MAYSKLNVRVSLFAGAVAAAVIFTLEQELTEWLGTAARLLQLPAGAGSVAPNLSSRYVCLQQCASGCPSQGHCDEWPRLHS